MSLSNKSNKGALVKDGQDFDMESFELEKPLNAMPTKC